MLNATQSKNVDSTLRYFQNLTQGDYYLGAEVTGSWRGKGASILGLGEGEAVTRVGFAAMLEGRHPKTGQRLTQRLRKDRRPCVDFTFSVPKSVSLAWAINRDEKLLDILRETVHESMRRDVEPLVCRRDRSGDKAWSNARMRTGNLVYADFLHTTSRPVDGTPDPQLHVHAVTFNHTTDGLKHYAADLEEVHRQLPSLQARFHARLSRRLVAEGYAVEQAAFEQSGSRKEGLQLVGLERSTIEKFSRRTEQIEEAALEQGITDAKAKGNLGAKTREKKIDEAPVAELRREWRSRLTHAEEEAFARLKEHSKAEDPAESDRRVAAAVEFALEHHLYRSSTVEKHTVVKTALEHGVTITPEQVEAALGSPGEGSEVLQRSRDVRGARRDYITTKAVLAAEEKMIAFARDGRGTRRQLGRTEHAFRQTFLNDQQRGAVNHVLASRDTVIGITGGAGTGKSSTLEELSHAIKTNGRKVFGFAPSTAARDVLKEKGFEAAETVAYLLKSEKLQKELKGQVLLIDEASLLDVRTMNGVFSIAERQGCRVVLVGDVRQHSGVRRGEAMRLLESEAGLSAARIDEVQRQKGDYKRAIELVSLGTTVIDHHTGLTGMLAGFDLLDKLGKIHELEDADRHEKLADNYLASRQKKKSTLIVCPTHAEGEAVTEKVRARLRRAGAVGGEDGERVFARLRSLNYTEAEKGDLRSYRQEDLVIEFHQNVEGGFQKGQRFRVAPGGGVPLLTPVSGGPAKRLPIDSVDRFEVYQQEEVALAPGDKVRFTLGGKATDGRPIINGRIETVKGFDAGGNVELASGMRVAPGYGHLTHGYAVTSHAAQGRDKSIAIAAMGSESLPAINAKQFYVTASRGREDLAIYVDDKQAIRRAIQDAGEQLSATELMRTTAALERHRERTQSREHRAFVNRVRSWWSQFSQRHRLWRHERDQNPEAGPALLQPELGR